MSQENVELVRSSIEAYIAGDREAVFDLYAEDVEGYPDVSRFPEAKPFRGRDEYRRFLAEIEEGWEGGASAVIREVFAVGDRVVARMDWGGRGRASGIDLRSSLTAINTVRDGRIVKIEGFSTTRRPSKPWACRSKTLAPTPESCGILRGRCRRRTWRS